MTNLNLKMLMFVHYMLLSDGLDVVSGIGLRGVEVIMHSNRVGRVGNVRCEVGLKFSHLQGVGIQVED